MGNFWWGLNYFDQFTCNWTYHIRVTPYHRAMTTALNKIFFSNKGLVFDLEIMINYNYLILYTCTEKYETDYTTSKLAYILHSGRNRNIIF